MGEQEEKIAELYPLQDSLEQRAEFLSMRINLQKGSSKESEREAQRRAGNQRLVSGWKCLRETSPSGIPIRIYEKEDLENL